MILLLIGQGNGSSFAIPVTQFFHRNFHYENVRFAKTRWSLVKRAAFRDDEKGSDFEEFCRIYWYPLYAVARADGVSPDEAADHVQTLLARIFAEGLLSRTDPARGRLRGWLATLLRRQINAGRRAARRQKRGGGAPHLSVDWVSAEKTWLQPSGIGGDAMAHYRRSLAAVLLDETIEALAAEYQQRGRHELFDALLPALESPLADETFAEVAARLGSTSGAVRMDAVRLRERFGRLLRKKCAVALGVPDGPELDQELREVFS